MKVSDLLQFMDRSEDTVNRLQIVTDGQVWDHAAEVYSDSELLKLVSGWEIYEMESTFSADGEPIIKIGITVGEEQYGRKQMFKCLRRESLCAVFPA